MSKKLLSTLIASLFAAAPALGQSADDPMRVQGTGTIGIIHNNSNASDTAKLDEYQDLGNGALSNVEFTLLATDTATGAQHGYFNRSAQFASQGDIESFPQEEGLAVSTSAAPHPAALFRPRAAPQRARGAQGDS